MCNRLEVKSIQASQELSELRLKPRLNDVDYLVYKERTRILEEWFARIEDNSLLVLDVGGRIQPYRRLLDGKIEQYVALDLQLEGLVNVLATVELLPFVDNSFDVVFCFQVLHYVPNPELAVKEMHRVLRPRGRLFLSTPSLFPEFHDHLWRFLPGGLRYLTRCFSAVEIQAEGFSGAGLLRAINSTLHTDIDKYWVLRLAQRTSVPLLNLLGLLLDRISAPNTRSTANYTLMAIK